MYLFTEHNFIGTAVHDLLVQTQISVQTHHLEELGSLPAPADNMIFINLINLGMPLVTAMVLLHKNRERLASSTTVLLIKEEMSQLCQILLGVDNIIVFTEKTPVATYANFINSNKLTRYVSGIKKSKLSAREKEVLELLIFGTSIKEIAAILHLSYKTVYFYKYNIMNKLNIADFFIFKSALAEIRL